MTHLDARALPLRSASRGAALLVTLPILASGALGQQTSAVDETAAAEGRALIAEALAEVSGEVRTFNDHLTILASPWMEGRLPGTRGMELAKEYMEFQFRASGLAPAVKLDPAMGSGGESASFRQPFNLGSTNEVTAASLALGPSSFEHGQGKDFTVTGLGVGGELDAPLVFVGYGIEDGRDRFTSFEEGTDLTGKVAVLLRFEPMDGEGNSLWTRRDGSWSRRAGFNGKLQAVAERGAVGAIIVNTPGANDARVDTLLDAGGGGRAIAEIPVLHLSSAAGERLVAAGTGGTQTLAGLRDAANAGAAVVEMTGSARIIAGLERRAVVAENVIGLLPGKGTLADEYIVVGAHLDHLGQGSFGSRDRANAGRLLHPGADDNASGSAGIILIADKMARDYEAAGEGANLRSVLFMGFSAEESGLNGSNYYANHPIAPIGKHVLMMNFDMIGRIKDRRLSLSGAETGAGLQEFLDPIIAGSPLAIVQPERMSGASDHTSFMRKDMPVLFAIIADFHGDYHTPRDVSSLINRVDAVHAANLFYEIALAAAGRPEAFAFVEQQTRRSARRRAAAAEPEPEEEPAGGAPRAATVQFGIRPSYTEAGVVVEGITPGSPAASAGLMKNDRIRTWNGEEVDLAGFSEKLKGAKPGDKVKVGLTRIGEQLEVEVTLKAREGGA
ncbi:MAG: M28 family peptidase [Planctomycetota bacterium]|nr:M28 family peptidase [Planctomycetota bacterium]